jgi:hypothetical protein
VVSPVRVNLIGLSNFTDLLVRIARWPAMLVALGMALAVIYRYGPSRETPRWRWVTWGSAVATILWLAVSGAQRTSDLMQFATRQPSVELALTRANYYTANPVRTLHDLDRRPDPRFSILSSLARDGRALILANVDQTPYRGTSTRVAMPLSLYVRSRRTRDDSCSGTRPAPSSCEIAKAASTVRLLISSF